MLVVVTGDKPEIRGRGRRTRTFRYLSRVAHEAGLRVFFTTPAEFRFGDSGARCATKGFVYRSQEDQFVQQQVNLDRDGIVIYDAMYLDDLKRHREAYRRIYRVWRRLKYRHFNPILPAKDQVYQLLSPHDLGTVRLPKSWYDVGEKRVLKLLSRHSRLWLKPVLGSGGRNIIVVERMEDNQYHVVADRFFGESLDKRFTEAAFRRLLSSVLTKRSYMAQKDIPLLRTVDGRKVDFRVTLARTGAREWRMVGLTARVGAARSELTNFHAGGRAMPFDAVMPMLDIPTDQMEEVREAMAKGGVRIAQLLARKHKMLGLLGVDMGVSRDGDVFVYDFNGRPGRDILKDTEVNQTMDCLVQFVQYLQKTSR